jgi:hypothetical protein
MRSATVGQHEALKLTEAIEDDFSNFPRILNYIQARIQDFNRRPVGRRLNGIGIAAKPGYAIRQKSDIPLQHGKPPI